MTATKVTTKPPSEEVLRARDDFKDFCVFMGKAPAKHMLEWHNELCTGEDSECLMGIGGPNTAILHRVALQRVLSLVCLQRG